MHPIGVHIKSATVQFSNSLYAVNQYQSTITYYEQKNEIRIGAMHQKGK